MCVAWLSLFNAPLENRFSFHLTFCVLAGKQAPATTAQKRKGGSPPGAAKKKPSKDAKTKPKGKKGKVQEVHSAASTVATSEDEADPLTNDEEAIQRTLVEDTEEQSEVEVMEETCSPFAHPAGPVSTVSSRKPSKSYIQFPALGFKSLVFPPFLDS